MRKVPLLHDKKKNSYTFFCYKRADLISLNYVFFKYLCFVFSIFIQVLEMFASEGDLHLELPSGDKEAAQDIWVRKKKDKARQ